LTRARQDAALWKTGKFEVTKQCLVPRPERGVGQGTFVTPLAGGSMSVLGSTLLFLGPAMRHKRGKNASSDDEPIALPVLTADEWATIVQTLHLTPRQAQVIELIFQAKKDKQIAAALGVTIWAVRAHLTQTFTRAGVSDRLELVLCIFAVLRADVVLQKTALQ
jgi:DNA-binding CsgD family transcriptional regulator